MNKNIAVDPCGSLRAKNKWIRRERVVVLSCVIDALSVFNTSAYY